MKFITRHEDKGIFPNLSVSGSCLALVVNSPLSTDDDRASAQCHYVPNNLFSFFLKK